MTYQFILDNNLSVNLINQISELSTEISHVSIVALERSSDMEIWQYAKQNGYTIITKDSDFKTLSNLFDCPPKVIRVNCGNQTNTYMRDMLLSKSNTIFRFMEKIDECYLELN